MRHKISTGKAGFIKRKRNFFLSISSAFKPNYYQKKRSCCTLIPALFYFFLNRISMLCFRHFWTIRMSKKCENIFDVFVINLVGPLQNWTNFNDLQKTVLLNIVNTMYILYAISKYIFRQVIDGIEFRNQRKFSRRPSNTSEEHGLENSVFEVGSGGLLCNQTFTVKCWWCRRI